MAKKKFDWQAGLTALASTLEEWNQRFDKERRTLAKERGLMGLFSFLKPDPEAWAQVAEQARARVGDEALVEADVFFDALGEEFASSLPQPRAEIRAELGHHPELLEHLWNYVLTRRDAISSKEDGPLLRQALLGIAMDDGRLDFDELSEALAGLWIAAKRSGLDPEPFFVEVGEVANRSTSGGAPQVRRLLDEFQTSLAYRRLVEPALRQARGA